MPTTNAESGTNVEEIADGIYRINTPLSEQVVPGGFSFNQYLILDEEPLLFHTGQRKLFPMVREAVATVIPVGRLRYVGLSHVEADECGSINEWLAAAPHAEPLCGQVAAMVSMSDLADRPPRRGRRRDDLFGHAPGPLVRHTPSASRVGVRLPARGVHAHAAVRRSLHAAWVRTSAADGDRHSRT
jgi:hypothetical protein